MLNESPRYNLSLFFSILVLGTVLVVDNFSDEKILPQSINALSSSGFSLKNVERSVYRIKYQIQQKWRDLTGKETPQKSQSWSTLKKKSSSDEEIVKWRDKHGVWHFEHKAIASESIIPEDIQSSSTEK